MPAERTVFLMKWRILKLPGGKSLSYEKAKCGHCIFDKKTEGIMYLNNSDDEGNNTFGPDSIGCVLRITLRYKAFLNKNPHNKAGCRKQAKQKVQ
jgi:hypothetical protein